MSGDADAQRSGIVTLLSDFGNRDAYAGTMKGVILGICPRALIVDLSHEVAPQAVDEAMFLLAGAWRFFPPGTVHVAVVDPGVGSPRAILAVAAEGHLFLAPDNGLLSPLLDAAEEVRRVSNARWFLPEVSAVFHGRDIFAPVAAHLAGGLPLRELGPALSDAVRLERSRPVMEGRRILGCVVHVDRFGNLVTNISRADLASSAGDDDLRFLDGDRPLHGVNGAVGVERLVRVAGREVGALRRTYSEAEEGELVALIGSYGYLEVSLRNGSAARFLGSDRGARVTVESRTRPG